MSRRAIAVAQDGTVAAPDSDEPIVTNAMIAAGISQLPSNDWTLAEITRTLRRVYVQMWRLTTAAGLRLVRLGADDMQIDDAARIITGVRSFGVARSKDQRGLAQQLVCQHGVQTPLTRHIAR